jgi:tRNA(Ile)-lysidine synthase
VIEARVRATGLVRAPAVVLLSGGQDSVSMLHLAVRVLGAAGVRALHVDHGLRAGSARDAGHCASLCERLGVALTVRHAGAAPATGNRQAWARERRSALAADLARASAWIVTGHTASDQAETVLYRLAAAPGRRALLGMPACSGAVVRPLLAAGVTRAETAAYCASHGLPFLADPSNETAEFARGRVRGPLLDALRSIHPAAEANVLRTAALLRDEAEVLDTLVAEALEAAGDPPRVAALASLPAALGRLALQALADAAAGGRAPAVGARAGAVWALAGRGGTAGVDLGGGLRAEVAYGALRVVAPAGRVGVPDAPGGAAGVVARLPVPGTARFAGGVVSAEPLRDGPVTGVPDGTLAATALATELAVRSWRAGDRMRPLGMAGRSRSLQDLFTDRKVPRARRHTLPVVLSAGEIAWVPGVATGEDFRVSAPQEPRVRLRWSEDARQGSNMVRADGA